MANDNKSLVQPRQNCKYQIVFQTTEEDTEAAIREIHEAEICTDHVHMLVSIPPKVAISSFMEKAA